MGLKAPEPNTKYAFSASALFVPFNALEMRTLKKRGFYLMWLQRAVGVQGAFFTISL